MTIDIYPTRTEMPSRIIERQDPVVYREYNQSDQLAKYERDGFLILRGISKEYLTQWQKVLLRISELKSGHRKNSNTHYIYEENSETLKSIFGFMTHNDEVSELLKTSGLVALIEKILGNDIHLYQSRINVKQAFDGKEFGWHSDFETWHAEDGMPRMRAVSVMLALSENTKFNGSMIVIPGSHKYFVSCSGATPNKNFQHSLVNQTIGIIPNEFLEELDRLGGMRLIELEAGDCLIFDCNLAHASNINMSPYSRINLFCCFNSLENKLGEPFGGTNPRPSFLAERPAHKFQ